MTTPTIAQIQAACCAHYGVGLADLLSDRREQRYVRPRHVAMWLARRLTRKSYAIIGRAFDRDHSTVQQSVRWLEGAMAAKRRDNADIWRLLAELQRLHATAWPQITVAHGWVAAAISTRRAAA